MRGLAWLGVVACGDGARSDPAATETTTPATSDAGPSTEPTTSTNDPSTTRGESSTGAGESSSSATGEPEPSWPPEPTPTVFPSAEHRVDNWTPIGPWEMGWDGTASAADLPRPFHTWFDNPHDDDFDADPTGRGANRYRFDDPGVGRMTVDRINAPDGTLCPLSPSSGYGGRRFTGNIWKRDAYLSAAAGLTLEVDVDIPDKHIQIQDEAFVMMTVLPHGSFAVYLSRDCLKIGPVAVPSEETRHSCASGGGRSARAFTTAGTHRYRIALAPDSLAVTVWIDDDPVPFLEGEGDALPYTALYAPGVEPGLGDAEYEHPYILIGDNTGSSAEAVAPDTDVSAAYVLDGIRWTRGVFPPGTRVSPPDEAEGPLRRRWPPVLPANASIDVPGIEFDALPPVVDPSGTWNRIAVGDAIDGFVLGRMDGEMFVADEAPRAARVCSRCKASRTARTSTSTSTV